MTQTQFKPSVGRVIDITLTLKDLSTKPVTVRVSKLPEVICWRGIFFLQDSEIGLTYYKQVDGEDLSNIEVNS
jgi:hypothetical protein